MAKTSVETVGKALSLSQAVQSAPTAAAKIEEICRWAAAHIDSIVAASQEVLECADRQCRAVGARFLEQARSLLAKITCALKRAHGHPELIARWQTTMALLNRAIDSASAATA